MVKSAEEKYLENISYGIKEEITCESISNVSKSDFSNCVINFDSEGNATITIKGSKRYNDLYICYGTKNNASAVNDNCMLVSLTVNTNGGTNIEYNEKYELGSSVTLTEPSREGYIFKGWTIESGEGAIIDGNILTMGKTTTKVVAIWEEINFATNSWATIVSLVRQSEETGTEYPYSVGDTKTIQLSSNLGTHTIRVANTTKCSDLQTQPLSKSACGFVLEFVDIITTHRMTSTYKNTGGWPLSEMRTYLNETIYNSLPKDLRDGIIDTYVVSSHGKEDTSGTLNNGNFGSTDKLYLLTPKEVYGSVFANAHDSSNGTSRQLDYYVGKITTDDHKEAIKKSGTTDTSWWMRSAYYNYISYFWYISEIGDAYFRDAGNVIGVSPAFRIGKES